VRLPYFPARGLWRTDLISVPSAIVESSSKTETIGFIDMGAGVAPYVSPNLWKAYGYWARPIVNHVLVHNATPGPIAPSSVDPLAVFNSLIGPHGTPHPERWIPHLQHPALPPRPNLPGWQTPHIGSPAPFPWECALNPFLVHSSVGRAPVTFDVGLDPSGVIYSETGPDITIPLSEADRAQPATYPLLTTMEIMDVADDTVPRFPWPMWVQNDRGITVQDVFEAISYNFSLHVSGDEFASWDERRQAQAGAAYWSKVIRNQAIHPHRAVNNDGLKRVDYLGDRVMFRGLEPSPRMDGTWMLFVGPI